MRVKIINEKSGYKYISNKPFFFKNGEQIPSLELYYETYGVLNKNKSNVILIHHSLSVGANAISWWKGFIGKSLAIDIDKYFIICINNLGSCFGSSGPSLNTINPKNDKPYLRDFPKFCFADIVNSQIELLNHLGINKLYAVIGSSMGGMISLSMLESYPKLIDRAFLCATAFKAYPFNIANRMVQKEVIENNDYYKKGYYTTNPYKALKTARKIGLLFYRGFPDLNDKFSSDQIISDIYRYYEYNSEKFSNSFDANSYVYNLNCMDNYHIDFSNFADKKSLAIKKIHIIGIDTDLLFPIYQQLELYDELKKISSNIKFIEHKTRYGHDSFFIEKEKFTKYLQDFFK